MRRQQIYLMHLFLHAVEEDHSPGVTAVLLCVLFSQKAVHVSPLGVFCLLVCASQMISLVNLTPTCSSSAAIAQPCLIAVTYFIFIYRVNQRGNTLRFQVHFYVLGVFLRFQVCAVLLKTHPAAV